MQEASLLPAGIEPACTNLADTFTDGWEDERMRRVLAAICAGCPVLRECVSYSLTNDVAGFAAGMTPKQRKRVQRRPDAAAFRECGWCRTDISGLHGNRSWCSERCRKNAYTARKNSAKKVAA